MLIIGLSGKARHGKDTCAKIIIDIADDAGLQFGKWALADPLKAQVFGQGAGKYSFEDVWVTKPPEVRRKLQLVGTEEGRNVYGLDYWVLQTHAYMRLFRENFPFIDGVVISDVRFPNEVEFVNAFGPFGLSLYIQSDRPTLTGEAALHASETSLDAVDKDKLFRGVINNNLNVTLNGLREQLEPYVFQLLESQT